VVDGAKQVVWPPRPQPHMSSRAAGRKTTWTSDLHNRTAGLCRKGHLSTGHPRQISSPVSIRHTAPKTRRRILKRDAACCHRRGLYLYRPENERDYAPKRSKIHAAVMENNRDDLWYSLRYKDRIGVYSANQASSRSGQTTSLSDYSDERCISN